MTAIFVSKRMAPTLPPDGAGRLERSCGPLPGDWLRSAPGRNGIERIEAFFTGHAYDPHRHDTYALGITLSGVQCFDYRGARADSVTGKIIALHPDERHDGRAGAAGGFAYRMVYLAPRLIRDALGARARALPFVDAVVSDDARLKRALLLFLDDLVRVPEDLEADQAVAAVAEALLALDPSARGRGEGPACAVAVERARVFLDAEFDRQVLSHELEAVSGLDRYTLARQFRARLGTSPYRYLTMRRLDSARAALGRGETIAEAACASGFADQSHLTRQFRQAYGLPPGRWRAIHAARLYE